MIGKNDHSKLTLITKQITNESIKLPNEHLQFLKVIIRPVSTLIFSFKAHHHISLEEMNFSQSQFLWKASQNMKKCNRKRNTLQKEYRYMNLYTIYIVAYSGTEIKQMPISKHIVHFSCGLRLHRCSALQKRMLHGKENIFHLLLIKYH